MIDSDTRALAEAIGELTVFDSHEHLRPTIEFGPMSLARLLERTYVQFALRSADGSPNSLGRGLVFELEDQWETIAHVRDLVGATSAFHWLFSALRELYDLPPGGLTREGWEILHAEIPARHARPEWLETVLDRARIAAAIWDPPWLAGSTAVPSARFLPSLRVNSSLVGFDPKASDFEGTNIVRDWAGDATVDSLDDLEQLCERVLSRNVDAGARALKLAIAYDRTLAVSRVSRRRASAIFDRGAQRLTERERRAFGDYMLRFWLDRARERGLVVQVHCGLARLEGSHPLLLAPLLQDFPDLAFDVFHAGYPWTRETAALAHSYPNVFVNLVWLPLLTTEVAVATLKEWVQLLPRGRILWGGDARVPEEMYGALLATRHVIARAIAELVADGQLGREDMVPTATAILRDGPGSLYRLESD